MSGACSQASRAADGRGLLPDTLKNCAIITLGRGGHIASWNRDARRINRYAASEVLGKHFSMLYPPDEIRAGKPGRELAMATAVGRCESGGWRIRKCGSRFWANMVTTVLRDSFGDLCGFAQITRDVSARPSREAVDCEKSERLESLFQALRVGVVVSGPDARVRMCNQAALELLSVHEDQLVGQVLFDPEPPGVTQHPSLGREASPVSRAIATRQPVCKIVTSVRRPPGGEEAWLLMSAEPLLAADGSVSEVLCSLTEINERQQAETLANNKKSRYEAAILASGQIFYDWDPLTNEIACAGDYQRLLGFTSEEMKGGLNGWLHLIHPDDRAVVRGLLDRVLATKEPFRLEYRVRRKDGTYMLAKDEGHFYLEEDGKGMRMAGFVFDITDQRRAEEEVRLSEQRFRSAFADAATGMSVCSLDGHFLEVNRAYCEFTGYGEHDLGGMCFTAVTHPDDLPENMRLINKMLAGEIPSYVIEKRYIRKDGTVVWGRGSVSLLRDGQHRPEHVISLIEDITERKQAEDELRQLSGRLLQMQDEERRRLARDLHDSTAQSLAALGMNLELVSQSALALDPQARRALDESLALADQCIEELRTYSYLLHPPLLDELGLSSALACYVNGFRERSGVRVDLQLSRDLGRLAPDVELMLFRVVQESLTKRHRGSGNRTVAIRIVRLPGEVLLEVKDKGHAVLDGLRQASMRERVRHLGGRLEVCTKGKGVVVQVVVPISEG